MEQTERPWEEDVRALAKRIPTGFAPDISDLDNLYSLLLEHEPLVVLELGSGFSTLVILHALATLGRGHSVSLESSDAFFHVVAIALEKRKAQLRERDIRIDAVVALSPCVTCNVFFSNYTYVPINEADFIYIDGPPIYGFARADITCLPFLPACPRILVDGRNLQVKFLQGLLEEFYSLEMDKENFRAMFTRRPKPIPLPAKAYALTLKKGE